MQQISPGAWQTQGNEFLEGLIPALAAGLKLGAMPKQMQQESQQRELQNALQKIALQYAPQNAQADLDYKGAQMGLMGAQTNSVNQETSYLPLKYAIEAQNSQQRNDRFGQAYQMSVVLKNMDPATRALWMSQHQEEYTDMLNTLASGQGNKGNDLLGPMMANYFPRMNQGTNPPSNPGQNVPPPTGELALSPEKIAVLQQALQQGNGGITPGAMTPFNFSNQGNQNSTPNTQQPFQSSPKQIEALKRSSELAANKYLNTAATRGQLEGAIQVNSVMNDPQFQEKAMNASEYAGAAGKGKSALAALSQKNPKAYEDYISFVNHDMVLLSNRIKALDKMGSTDEQRKELNSLYDKTMDSLTSNPQQFLTQLNNLGESLDRIGKAVQKSASPVADVNRIENFKPIKSSGARTYNPTTGELE